MATEAFYYPEEQTGLFADIIEAGLTVLEGQIVQPYHDPRLTPAIAASIREHLEEMREYADRLADEDDEDDTPIGNMDIYPGDDWR